MGWSKKKILENILMNNIGIIQSPGQSTTWFKLYYVHLHVSHQTKEMEYVGYWRWGMLGNFQTGISSSPFIKYWKRRKSWNFCSNTVITSQVQLSTVEHIAFELNFASGFRASVATKVTVLLSTNVFLRHLLRWHAPGITRAVLHKGNS